MKTEMSCDVLVAGGGVSGVSAALAAARNHARTILIEKEDFLGGTGYSGLFQNICGLYLSGKEFPKETLNAGIAREIVERLHKISPDKKVTKVGQVYVLPYDREGLRSLFQSLCESVPELNVLYNSSVNSVENRDGEITAVEVDGPGGVRTIKPGVLIDCSGTGRVSAMAGAQFDLSPPETIQLSGYIVHVKGLRDVDESLAIKVPYYLAEGVNKEMLPDHLRFTMFSPGDSADEGYCKMSVNAAMQEDRDWTISQDVSSMLRFLAERIPAFKDATVAETSNRIMDREGRRICGEYTLTEQDVLNAGKFHDSVAKNSWPIELWDKKRGTSYKYLEPGEYYEIPFRSIKVRGISNLLCAGRCISATHEALGSTRVMGTCISLGEQAGLAASYYARNGRYPFGN